MNEFFTPETLNNNLTSFVSENAIVTDKISTQLNEWQSEIEQILASDYPYQEHEKIFLNAKKSFDSGESELIDVREDFEHMRDFKTQATLPDDSNFWQKKLDTFSTAQLVKNARKKHLPNEFNKKIVASDALRILHTSLRKHWNGELKRKKTEWELEKSSKLKTSYLKKLEEWLEQLKLISDALEKLGLEPGYFLDYSQGSLSYSDIEQLTQWAEYISEDQGVKDLCDLLGKLRQVSLSEKIEIAKNIISVPVTIPDIHAKEEITGIKIGNELEHALPSELALLSDPETSILFDLKYAEGRLMCFDMQGLQADSKEIEVEQEQQVSEEDKMGPIVICIDTSGSMHGAPETIAKAITLFLTTTAREQNRDCYLINFSTGIETLDLSSDYSLKNLLDFLKMSFHGGTDAAPAISHGLEVMQEDSYQNADMLIISDFVMSSLPETMLQAIEQQRETGNRFYSLCVGNEFMTRRLKTHFDREWIYNPASSSIKELINFREGLLERQA